MLVTFDTSTLDLLAKLGVPTDVSPYELSYSMVRDGKPRDVANRRIHVNDTVRVWTKQSGWTQGQDFFVKHMLPRWVPYKQHTMFLFLLVPHLDDGAAVRQIVSDPGPLTENDLQIGSRTTLLLTKTDVLAVREGVAEERVRVVVEDFCVIKMEAAEAGVVA
jgi:hypothetical protein